ncbi:hypothetical protein AgCh_029316 [Apium graveolens]
MEAEYIAVSEAAKEAVWIRKFITGLGMVPSITDPVDLNCENNGAIAQVKEPRSHSRTKHILRRYHLLREINERGDIHICKVHTNDNVADPLTKALLQQKQKGQKFHNVFEKTLAALHLREARERERQLNRLVPTPVIIGRSDVRVDTFGEQIFEMRDAVFVHQDQNAHYSQKESFIKKEELGVSSMVGTPQREGAKEYQKWANLVGTPEYSTGSSDEMRDLPPIPKNSSKEPKTPVYVEDDDFVDRNEEFINLDDDLVDVEDESDGNEVENEVENDSDNVEGEDEDDNVEDANLYENVDGGGVPYLNQNFQSVDEAGHFFRAYALRNGFAIKIQASHRNKDNEIYGRLYVCRLYGKSVVAESSQNKRRREVLPKSECKMNLVQRERHVNTATRSLIKTLYGSGVRNCQVMNVIGNIHGGNDKVGFNVQHVRNVLRDERKKRFEISDAQAGLDLLHMLNEESGSKYFIRTEVDEENRLKCLVWIDPRCIMAYQNFGDVMAFDTTYRTNRYAMPFVPFTGVNHHYQSGIFGFALMRDEHALTFEWILRTWLEGVGNNPPLTIITNQDQAMASAITVVLPNTTHLLCSWHISQKFPEKLAHYYSAFPEFKTDFNNCIYKSLTECVFEARWASFVEKYHLQDHKWLKGLYELKHKWIPAYTRNKFSAFQNSTSRSEGMNSFFDKYVSSATGLKEFIENAQKALARQFMREKEEDYVTINLKRPMKLHTTLEYHASCIYTKEMFRRFQDKMVESSKYFVEKDR